jgi:hypothetical protein
MPVKFQAMPHMLTGILGLIKQVQQVLQLI